MSFTLLNSSSLDHKEWDKLLESTEAATFYHTSVWADLWEKSYDFCRALYFVEKIDSGYALALPLIKIRKKGWESLFSMPMGGYGGPVNLLSAESQKEEFLLEVLSIVKSLKTLRFQIVDFLGKYPFSAQAGLTSRQAFTHLIELGNSDLDGLLTKRGFQQAERKKVKARKIEAGKEVQICYDLYLKTCQRHKTIPKYSQPFYLNIFNSGKGCDWLLWWLAEVDNKIIGYQINFVFKDELYLWDGGSDPEGLSWRTNDFLMGQSLKWCKEHNLFHYNLGGSPPGTEGLVHFKEQWGGKRKSYQVYEKTFTLAKLVDILRRR